MRICFICGSLEPGRDGVGDYVRRLGTELIRQGHQVAAVALVDRHISVEGEGTQEDGGAALMVLRLPAVWPATQRFNRAREWIRLYSPDWLSLQFVVYGFSRKGWPFGISRQLAGLTTTARWHVMFHELWIGMEIGAPWRQIFLGALQRRGIQLIIARLKPKAIHTQTRLYVAQLEKLGHTAELLPLFGNIPNSGQHTTVMNPARDIAGNEIRLVHFGSIHPGAHISAFAKELRDYAKTHGKAVLLTLIGRCGTEGPVWERVGQEAGMQTRSLGEQSRESVSEILSQSSIGLTSTPLVLVGKSGSVATMVEHGLPVICLARDWQPRGFSVPESPLSGVVAYHIGHLESALEASRRHKRSDGLALVARRFSQKISLTS